MSKVEDGLLVGGSQNGRVCPVRPEIMADPTRRPAWIEYAGDRYRRVDYGGRHVYVSSVVPALRTMSAIEETLRCMTPSRYRTLTGL